MVARGVLQQHSTGVAHLEGESMNETTCGPSEIQFRPIVRRGRPSLGDAALRSNVSVCLPEPLHDRLIRLANERGVSVSQVVRQMILAHLR